MRLFQKSAHRQGDAVRQEHRGRWTEWEKMSNMALDARLAELRKETQKLLDLQADLQKQGKTLSPGRPGTADRT